MPPCAACAGIKCIVLTLGARGAALLSLGDAAGGGPPYRHVAPGPGQVACGGRGTPAVVAVEAELMQALPANVVSVSGAGRVP